MDQQDPRLTRKSGKGDRETTGLDRPSTQSGVAELMDDGPSRMRGSLDRPPARDMGDESGQSDGVAESPGRKTREIRAEIDQVRDNMSDTVNAIQDRLRPGTIASNAAESVKHAALDKARDIAESDSVKYVRANPFATAMLGVGVAGLAWMVFGPKNGGAYRGPAADDAWRRAQSEGDERLGYAIGGVSTDRVRAGYRQSMSQAENAAQRAWNQSPLLIGAAVAVLGAIVALAVPETERERELMGETRDQMMDSVHESVRDTVTKVKQVATETAGTVQGAAKDATSRVAALVSADDDSDSSGNVKA